MAIRVKVPQAAGIRQSMEVQNGSKGLGRMFRRGLHGSKNWVLELDENGEHRSVWAKGGRAFIVLIPVWVVLSAATGGPERGGHSTSVPQALGAALLLTVIGLAVFSARERKLGREEPWVTEGGDSKGITESEDGENKTLVDPAPENSTQILENPQVEESGSDDGAEQEMDDSEDSVETERFEQPDLQEPVQQAIPSEAETRVMTAPEAPTTVLPQVVQQATSDVADQDKSGQSFEDIASVANDFRTEASQQASQEPAYSLVKDSAPDMQEPVQQATPQWTKLDVSGVTEGDNGLIPDEPTTPLRTTVQTALHQNPDASESVQVSLEKEPVQQPLQGELQVQFAQAGPYPAGEEPEHEDWWVVAPDIEPAAEAEEVALEPVQEDVAPEPVPVFAEAAEAEQEASQVPVGRHPMVVLTYLASQAPKSGFTPEEKEAARTAVITWLHGEIQQGHLNRAEGARVLGVDASTVGRWLSDLNDDPWAG
jgi:hypothetical protein